MPLFIDSKIYKAKHVAKRLETTEDFIWREIRKGNVRSIRLASNLVRLRGSDLNEWIERGITRPSDENLSSPPVAVGGGNQ
jgi:excisionase family DNA binding protein